MQKKWITLLLIGLCPFIALSQRNIQRQAELLVEHNKYKEAVVFYDQLINNEAKAEWYFGRAICFYNSNQLSYAKTDLKSASNKGLENPLYWYYLARIAHAEENFETATSNYKSYLRNISTDHKDREKVRSLIKNCGTGIQLKYDAQYAFVENMGSKVNTRNNEFGAVESPTILGKYYFNSNRVGSVGGLRDKEGLKDNSYGNYKVDIYSIESNGGNWSDVKPISALINGPQHDVMLDFSSDGSFLIYYKSKTLSNGGILLDSFNLQEDMKLSLDPYISPVVGELGDIFCHMFNDSTLVFASQRSGGFGGYDLYVTQKRNKRWITPINMGPEVNTAYDEVSPSLSHDGTILYFSSNSINSVGGFDIFKSTFDYSTKSWRKSKNLGFPVNSSEDDMYFMLSSDGRTALFSSNRKSGVGGFDLYLAYLKEQETSQLTFTPVLPYLFFNQKEINQREEELVVGPTMQEEQEEELVREYLIKPLYYGDDDLILHPDNVSKIRALADILILYPNLKLKISSHSTKEDLKSYEMYFSIKRAEKVAKELISYGIEPGRLITKAFGANYPVAKTEENGGSKNLASRYNRRIDLHFIDDDEDVIIIKYEEPVIADFLQDRRFSLFQTLEEGLTYRVEVAQINQMFSNDILQEYSDAMVEQDFNQQIYRYTLGLYSKYDHAQLLKKDLIMNGLIKARVIAYLDGLPIPISKLVDLTADYPDLANYLQHEH
jgi:outer membrane protein OmpA-like peptidoglycan-associated protein